MLKPQQQPRGITGKKNYFCNNSYFVTVTVTVSLIKYQTESETPDSRKVFIVSKVSKTTELRNGKNKITAVRKVWVMNNAKRCW